MELPSTEMRKLWRGQEGTERELSFSCVLFEMFIEHLGGDTEEAFEICAGFHSPEWLEWLAA